MPIVSRLDTVIPYLRHPRGLNGSTSDNEEYLGYEHPNSANSVRTLEHNHRGLGFTDWGFRHPLYLHKHLFARRHGTFWYDRNLSGGSNSPDDETANGLNVTSSVSSTPTLDLMSRTIGPTTYADIQIAISTERDYGTPPTF